MATHSSILAWRIPRMERLAGYSPWGHKESDTTGWLPFTYICVNRQCLFFSFLLLHSVWQPLGPSTSLHLTQFCSFFGWVIFHHVYIYITSSPFLCWWTSRMPACPGLWTVLQGILGRLSFGITVFSGYMPSSGIAGSYGRSIFLLQETSTLFSIMVVSVYISNNSARGFPFLHTLSSIYCL